MDNDVTMLVKGCDPAGCQGLCCYDGVYLLPGEDELIRAVVGRYPEHFAGLPGEYIVAGSWPDGTRGVKTATRPFAFTTDAFPPHFNHTRCVFATSDHMCLLQGLAVHLGVHKWTFKPTACWLFPLTIKEGELAPPPLPGEPDPDYVDESYPGYVTFVPCGTFAPDGNPWQQAFADEIAFFDAVDQLPLWANRGLPLEEIIERAKP
ncbi:hypothetical protein M1B72_16415 [Geomonas paludis]|uniref:DUF3109 domain-containing protein n=1 Tax=Geomonas paludis TaxID=2740185 RepID=A0A6V8MWR2_9BACT|nr:hypothetical protein [Geomonas paludis]UPU35021.1 hypothetical protein M1B72_16415 [Geomonas paludis]GFO64521.1 hypothetical protein GMPD_24400 [Geomonas paludis]